MPRGEDFAGPPVFGEIKPADFVRVFLEILFILTAGIWGVTRRSEPRDRRREGYRSAPMGMLISNHASGWQIIGYDFNPHASRGVTLMISISICKGATVLC